MNTPNSQVTEAMLRAVMLAKYGDGDVTDMLRGGGDEEVAIITTIIEAALTARTEARPNELDAAIAQRDAVAGKLAWLEESVRNAGCEIDYSVQSSGESADDCVWNRRAEEAETAAPPAAGEGFVVVPVEATPEMIAADLALDIDATPADSWRAMLAARPQPAQGDGWLPIESAPNDVGIIVAYAVGTKGRIDIGFVDADENDYTWQADDGKRLQGVSVPTHWRPLPPPPAPADGGK